MWRQPLSVCTSLSTPSLCVVGNITTERALEKYLYEIHHTFVHSLYIASLLTTTVFLLKLSRVNDQKLVNYSENKSR